MKIGILSLPLYVNYGGILQTFALQTHLERMGHNVEFIQRRNWPLKVKIKDMPLIYTKRILKKFLADTTPLFYERIYNQEAPIIRQQIEPFVRKYIRTNVVDEYKQVHKDKYDAIVVGSDQIWRPRHVEHIENAYLDFTEGWDIKRISYAASFGTDEWEYSSVQTQRCGKLLRSFNAVSVREASGVNLCREHFKIEAKHVLDPTMLLESQDYMKLCGTNNLSKNTGNLLCYILDENKEKSKLIDVIAQQNHLKPFRVNARPDYRLDVCVEERIQPPVEDWLRGFYDAEFVITDSFHACVFSILFKKPFVVYGNANRGMSRFKSLLDMFGLQDRIINNFADHHIPKKIDWNEVYSILDERRKASCDFLERALC